MHTSDKPLRKSDLIKIIKKLDIEITARGNKYFLFRSDIPAIYTMHNLHGNKEYSRAVIRSIRSHFHISIQDFYKHL